MSDIPIPSGKEKIAYQGKIIEVVEQPMYAGEKQFVFEFARRSPGARLIIPTQDGNVLLSKEFRTEIEGYDFRLPGGKVFDTLKEYNAFLQTGRDIKEKARETAIKEAKEEVGITVESIEHLGVSHCGATVEWDLHYFLVTQYSENSAQHLEDGENITIVPTSVEDARTMCLDGRIQEERSALTLLRYLNNLNKIVA